MQGKFVLLLDDDHDDSALLEECFCKYHTLPVKCFDAPAKLLKFLDKQRSDQIALMVIDLNLPEMSGTDVIKLIKNKPEFSNVPILVFTTGGTPAERHFCFKNGIEKFRKPSNIGGWESFADIMATHCDYSLARKAF